MSTLTIKSFSCIKSAAVDLKSLTIFIGPQASGKSIISKLIYFFVDINNDRLISLEETASFEGFSEKTKEKFIEWFPVSAWGKEKFVIEFKLGDFEVKLSRNAYKNTVNDNLRILFSAPFKNQYNDLLALVKKSDGSEKSIYLENFERRHLLRTTSKKLQSEGQGKEYIETQLFIPAGRSFFTNLNRAIMAFDQGQQLDPMTLKFGRLYSSLHADIAQILLSTQASDRINATTFAELIGGKVVRESNKLYLVSNDGRKVPFSSLSSGQQELLPLIAALSISFGYSTSKSKGTDLYYIEEPEAHLFPEAQSKLVSALSRFLNGKQNKRKLIITTHSPYVLSKFNNLIKAGALSQSLSSMKEKKLALLISNKTWLKPGEVAAYALIDGEVNNIIDENGFIAADYLDKVSTEMSKEYSELLELEYGE